MLKNDASISVTCDANQSDDLKCIEFLEIVKSESPLCIHTCTGRCESKCMHKLKKRGKYSNLAHHLLIGENGILPAKYVNSKLKDLAEGSLFLASSNHPYHKYLARCIRQEAKDICDLNVAFNERRKSKSVDKFQKMYSPYLNKEKANYSNDERYNEIKTQNEIDNNGQFSEFLHKENCGCCRDNNLGGISEHSSTSTEYTIDYEVQKLRDSPSLAEGRRIKNNQNANLQRAKGINVYNKQNLPFVMNQAESTNSVASFSQLKNNCTTNCVSERTSLNTCLKVDNISMLDNTVISEQENVNKALGLFDFNSDDKDSAFTTSSPYDNQEDDVTTQTSSIKSVDSGASLSPCSGDKLPQNKPLETMRGSCINNHSNSGIAYSTENSNIERKTLLGSNEVNQKFYALDFNPPFDVSENFLTPRTSEYSHFSGNYNFTRDMSNLTLSTPIPSYCQATNNINKDNVNMSRCMNSTVNVFSSHNLNVCNEMEVYSTQQCVREVEVLEKEVAQNEVNTNSSSVINNENCNGNEEYTLLKCSIDITNSINLTSLNNAELITSIPGSPDLDDSPLSKGHEKFQTFGLDYNNCLEKENYLNCENYSSIHLSEDETVDVVNTPEIINEPMAESVHENSEQMDNDLIENTGQIKNINMKIEKDTKIENANIQMKKDKLEKKFHEHLENDNIIENANSEIGNNDLNKNDIQVKDDKLMEGVNEQIENDTVKENANHSLIRSVGEQIENDTVKEYANSNLNEDVNEQIENDTVKENVNANLIEGVGEQIENDAVREYANSNLIEDVNKQIENDTVNEYANANLIEGVCEQIENDAVEYANGNLIEVNNEQIENDTVKDIANANLIEGIGEQIENDTVKENLNDNFIEGVDEQIDNDTVKENANQQINNDNLIQNDGQIEYANIQIKNTNLKKNTDIQIDNDKLQENYLENLENGNENINNHIIEDDNLQVYSYKHSNDRNTSDKIRNANAKIENYLKENVNAPIEKDNLIENEQVEIDTVPRNTNQQIEDGNLKENTNEQINILLNNSYEQIKENNLIVTRDNSSEDLNNYLLNNSYEQIKESNLILTRDNSSEDLNNYSEYNRRHENLKEITQELVHSQSIIYSQSCNEIEKEEIQTNESVSPDIQPNAHNASNISEDVHYLSIKENENEDSSYAELEDTTVDQICASSKLVQLNNLNQGSEEIEDPLNVSNGSDEDNEKPIMNINSEKKEQIGKDNLKESADVHIENVNQIKHTDIQMENNLQENSHEQLEYINSIENNNKHINNIIESENLQESSHNHIENDFVAHVEIKVASTDQGCSSSELTQLEDLSHVSEETEDTSTKIIVSINGNDVSVMTNGSFSNEVTETTQYNLCNEKVSSVNKKEIIKRNYLSNEADEHIIYDNDCIPVSLLPFGTEKDSPDSPVDDLSSDDLNDDYENLKSCVTHADILSPSINESFEQTDHLDSHDTENNIHTQKLKALTTSFDGSPKSNKNPLFDKYHIENSIKLVVSIPFNSLPQISIPLKLLNSKDIKRLKRKIKNNIREKIKVEKRNKDNFCTLSFNKKLRDTKHFYNSPRELKYTCNRNKKKVAIFSQWKDESDHKISKSEIIEDANNINLGKISAMSCKSKINKIDLKNKGHKSQPEEYESNANSINKVHFDYTNDKKVQICPNNDSCDMLDLSTKNIIYGMHDKEVEKISPKTYDLNENRLGNLSEKERNNSASDLSVLKEQLKPSKQVHSSEVNQDNSVDVENEASVVVEENVKFLGLNKRKLQAFNDRTVPGKTKPKHKSQNVNLIGADSLHSAINNSKQSPKEKASNDYTVIPATGAASFNLVNCSNNNSKSSTIINTNLDALIKNTKADTIFSTNYAKHCVSPTSESYIKNCLSQISEQYDVDSATSTFGNYERESTASISTNFDEALQTNTLGTSKGHCALPFSEINNTDAVIPTVGVTSDSDCVTSLNCINDHSIPNSVKNMDGLTSSLTLSSSILSSNSTKDKTILTSTSCINSDVNNTKDTLHSMTNFASDFTSPFSDNYIKDLSISDLEIDSKEFETPSSTSKYASLTPISESYSNNYESFTTPKQNMSPRKTIGTSGSKNKNISLFGSPIISPSKIIITRSVRRSANLSWEDLVHLNDSVLRNTISSTSNSSPNKANSINCIVSKPSLLVTKHQDICFTPENPNASDLPDSISLKDLSSIKLTKKKVENSAEVSEDVQKPKSKRKLNTEEEFVSNKQSSAVSQPAKKSKKEESKYKAIKKNDFTTPKKHHSKMPLKHETKEHRKNRLATSKTLAFDVSSEKNSIDQGNPTCISRKTSCNKIKNNKNKLKEGKTLPLYKILKDSQSIKEILDNVDCITPKNVKLKTHKLTNPLQVIKGKNNLKNFNNVENIASDDIYGEISHHMIQESEERRVKNLEVTENCLTKENCNDEAESNIKEKKDNISDHSPNDMKTTECSRPNQSRLDYGNTDEDSSSDVLSLFAGDMKDLDSDFDDRHSHSSAYSFDYLDEKESDNSETSQNLINFSLRSLEQETSKNRQELQGFEREFAKVDDNTLATENNYSSIKMGIDSLMSSDFNPESDFSSNLNSTTPNDQIRSSNNCSLMNFANTQGQISPDNNVSQPKGTEEFLLNTNVNDNDDSKDMIRNCNDNKNQNNDLINMSANEIDNTVNNAVNNDSNDKQDGLDDCEYNNNCSTEFSDTGQIFVSKSFGLNETKNSKYYNKKVVTQAEQINKIGNVGTRELQEREASIQNLNENNTRKTDENCLLNTDDAHERHKHALTNVTMNDCISPIIQSNVNTHLSDVHCGINTIVNDSDVTYNSSTLNLVMAPELCKSCDLNVSCSSYINDSDRQQNKSTASLTEHNICDSNVVSGFSKTSIFGSTIKDTAINSGTNTECDTTYIQAQSSTHLGSFEISKPNLEAMKEGEITQKKGIFCNYEKVCKTFEPSALPLKNLVCPELPIEYCYKYFMENRCQDESCTALHSMENVFLIPFLGKLIPYYLNRGLISMAWSILETQSKTQKENGFFFTVSALKPLARIRLNDANFITIIPDLARYPLMASEMEILCKENKCEAAFKLLYDNYVIVEDPTAKKLMFFLFIRVCENQCEKETPFQRVVKWGFMADLTPSDVSHFRLEMDSHWLLFQILNKKEENVLKCYQTLNESQNLDPEYFTATTTIFLNFIEDAIKEKVPGIIFVIDQVVKRKLKDSKIFEIIAAILRRDLNKILAFRFFEAIFTLEPSFTRLESMALLDLALQFDVVLAVNTVSFIVQACKNEPLQSQLSLIICRLKTESNAVDWGLVKKLCFGLSSQLLNSVAKQLQYLLVDVPRSEDADMFIDKMKAVGCHLNTSVVEKKSATEVKKGNECILSASMKAPSVTATNPGECHHMTSGSMPFNPELTSSPQLRKITLDRMVIAPFFDNQDMIEGGMASTSRRSLEGFRLPEFGSKGNHIVGVSSGRRNSADSERTGIIKKFSIDLLESSRSDDPVVKTEIIKHVFVELTQTLNLSEVDQIFQNIGVCISGSIMEKHILVDEEKNVLGLLGSALVLHCIIYKLPNKAASIIITLRNLDIKFHEYQSMFMRPPPTQQRFAMMGLYSLFTVSKYAPIEIILREVDWRETLDEKVCSENVTVRLHIFKDIFETLLQKFQVNDIANRDLSFLIQMIKFLVDLYQHDIQVIAATNYQDIIDICELIRLAMNWHLETKQDEILPELKELVLACKRNAIFLPPCIEQHLALGHNLGQPSECTRSGSMNKPYSNRTRELPNRRVRPDVPPWALRTHHGNSNQRPARIHQRVEWPNMPPSVPNDMPISRRRRGFRGRVWNRSRNFKFFE